MSVISAVFLGIVQGVAEFLPISSSGHLSIFQNFFNLTTAEEGHLLFDVLLHLATLVSVCIAYRRDLYAIITEGVDFCRNIGRANGDKEKKYPAVRLLVLLFFATLPLFLILPINDYIESLYSNTYFIGIALILTGCMLFISDKMVPGRKNEKNLSIPGALIIGLCQAVATVPGLSRSGTTISAGIAVGSNRAFAVKFSFLMSIPAILGANILALADAVKEGIDASLLPAYLVGMLVAGVVGYFCIKLVQMLSKAGRFGKFCYYCWAVGIITIILSIFL